MPDDPRPEPELPHPEAAYGGADAVEKTSYVTGSGTNPEARAGKDEIIAQTPPGGGANPIAWLAIGLVVVIALIYAAGVFL